MSKLQTLVAKSANSIWYKKLLNFAVARAIPFNAPHHFTISEASPGKVTIQLPYKRSNLNHVKGIHACALATLCEFTTGMSLITLISEKEYRIILKSLKIDYHYQARMDVEAKFELTDSYVEENIKAPLLNTDSVFLDFEIKVLDKSSNLICTGFMQWQVKKWSKVKTAG